MNPMRAKKLRPEDVNVFLWATKSFSTSASVRVWRCFCFRSDNFLSLHFHTVLGPAMIFVSEKDSPKVEKIAASVRDVLMRAETLFTIPLRVRLINLLSPPRTEFKRDQSDLAWRLSAWLEIYGEKRAGLTTFGNAAWGATRGKTIFLVFVFCITNRARIVRTRNENISITFLNRVVAIAADDVNDSYVRGSRKAESTLFESSWIRTM